MHWISKFVDCMFPLEMSKTKFQEGFDLKFQNLPNGIFKYRECDDFSFANLDQDKVWLADPTTFNDPYDCHHFANFDVMGNNLIKNLSADFHGILSKEQEEKLEKLIEINERPLDALAQIIWGEGYAFDKKRRDLLNSAWQAQNERLASECDKLKTAFRLCSFSERVDSPLMWAHYAKNHQGFCIEYDVKSLPENNVISRLLFPVVYQDEIFNATEAVMRYGDADFNSTHTFKSALIKAPDWSYEKEWRLIFTEATFERPCSVCVPKAKAVYLGSHIKETDEEAIKKICDAKDIPMLKMKHSRSEFRMTAEKL